MNHAWRNPPGLKSLLSSWKPFGLLASRLQPTSMFYLRQCPQPCQHTQVQAGTGEGGIYLCPEGISPKDDKRPAMAN